MSYSAQVLSLLERSGAKEGDRIVVETDRKRIEGILMPHHSFSNPDIIILKLKNGYNVGVKISGTSNINLIEKALSKGTKRSEHAMRPEKKTVSIIGTGGTIASYVDYRTGAVHPALTADELVSAVPEIADICNVKARVLFSIFSENMTVERWQMLAEAVADELRDGVEGCIVPHGTDTMGYTAAALSFMFENLPRPVILVGAQRSSDRPSSDAYTNLIAAVRFAVESDVAEACVLMHESPSDTSALIHRGTKVRKMHTSRRDAFASINARPIARIHFEGGIEYLSHYKKKNDDRVVLKKEMEENVALLYFYPGMSASKFERILNEHKGIVIAGSGLGHVSSDMVQSIARAIRSGTTVVMTSQCLYGRTNLNVYDTGRDLLAAGVIPGEDMLPETAYVKLMWVLAHASSEKEIESMMRENLRGEISPRRELDD
ncbi:MAG: Glu-tRNA(Gln) amidotransferase subunit GatD [Methanomassiliicoccales archaeon]|jgi:glutamyl-tRNA(Gln) amidotransferase subunit D|nr:Glu-tRNA(Gln) amidotransferase subunit GatD [Methanomassiliicoccales archaeon]